MTKNEDLSPLSPEWVDVTGAAALVKLAVSYMHNMRHDKRGPKFLKRNNRIYYRRDELLAWNDERLERHRSRAAKSAEKAPPKRGLKGYRAAA